jgi:hypothetical protein
MNLATVIPIYFLLSPLNLFSQISNSSYVENAKGLCDGIYLNVDELISNRTPSLSKIKFGSNNVNLPSKCLSNLNDELQEYINKFRAQDRANLQNIVNNYCSHLKGWVEYNPGTCSAGGPPPICPKNHWYQNPSKAMDDFYAERNKIYNQRLQSLEDKKTNLMNGACACWLNELKETGTQPTYKKPTNPQSDASQSYQTTNIKIQCINGQCPIGFKCVNGYCVESSVEANIKENTGIGYKEQEKIKDKFKDWAIGKILDYAEKKFKDLALLRGFYNAVNDIPLVAVIKGVLEPTQIGTFSSIYQSELLEAQANANQLEKLYEELRRNKLNMYTKPALPHIPITSEIAKYRIELGKNIFNLNSAADGIEREKEMGSCSCYNILNYNNSIVTEALNKLIDKSIE